MASLSSIRRAAANVNKVVQAADKNRDGVVSKKELVAELTRTKAPRELRTATLSAFGHVAFGAADHFAPTSVPTKRTQETVSRVAKEMIELDGKRRGAIKDGQLEPSEFYASTNQLSRRLLAYADSFT